MSRSFAGGLLAAVAVWALFFPFGVLLTHHHGPDEDVGGHHGGWAFRLPDHQHTRPHLETAEPVWHPVCAVCARLSQHVGELSPQSRCAGLLAPSGDLAAAVVLAPVSTLRATACPRGPPLV